MQGQNHERDPDSTTRSQVTPVPKQVDRVELVFVLLFQLDRGQDLVPHGLNARVVSRSIVEPLDDIVALGLPALGVVPTGGVGEEPHAHDRDGGEGGLEGDGEPPRHLVRHAREAEVHPVRERDPGNEPDALDGDLGPAFFGVDAHLGHVGRHGAGDETDTEATEHTADDDLGDRPRRGLDAGADDDERVPHQDATPSAEGHAEHRHGQGTDRRRQGVRGRNHGNHVRAGRMVHRFEERFRGLHAAEDAGIVPVHAKGLDFPHHIVSMDRD